MTNCEVAAHYTVIWSGGELLPAYPSSGSLSEIARTPMRFRDEFGDVKTQRRYTPEEKATMRHLRLQGKSVSEIAALFGMPVASVKGIVPSGRRR